MKIPKNVKIGKLLYKIEICKRINKQNSLMGRVDYQDKKIKILKMSDNRQIEMVLFHEIAHGIIGELEFNYPKISIFKDDEIFIGEFTLLLRKTFLDLLDKQDKKNKKRYELLEHEHNKMIENINNNQEST